MRVAQRNEYEDFVKRRCVLVELDVNERHMRRARGSVRALLVAGVAAAAAILCGCTSLASGSDTEEAVVALDPKWSCLGKPGEALPIPNPVPKNIAFALPISDYRIMPPVPVPNLTVTACQIQDYECSMPAGLVLSPMNYPVVLYGKTYQVPVYPVVMPYAIDAFIRLTAPGYLQTEYYLGGPLLGSRDNMMMNGVPVVVALPVTPILASDADDLALAVQHEREPGDAIVAMRTLDCNDEPTDGVTLSLSVDGVPFTFLTGQPSFGANQATDSGGLAGFANIAVPAGSFSNVTVEGMAPNGMTYGKINVTIRPGQLTQADIRPDTGLFGF
jgi:hypothetical protein